MIAGEVVANLLGLMGALMLFVPAMYGAWVVRRASRLDRLAGIVDDPVIEQRRAAAVNEILSLQDKWNPWLALCLFGGLAMSVLSYGVLLYRELS